jgi:hypothetical protein
MVHLAAALDNVCVCAVQTRSPFLMAADVCTPATPKEKTQSVCGNKSFGVFFQDVSPRQNRSFPNAVVALSGRAEQTYDPRACDTFWFSELSILLN